MKRVKKSLLIFTIISISWNLAHAQFWGDSEYLDTKAHSVVNGVLRESPYVHTIIENDILYYTDTYGFHIYNVSDMTNPIKISDTAIAGQATHFDLNGDYAYILTDLGFVVVNIADVQSPTPEKYVFLEKRPYKIATEDNIAYIATGEGFITYSLEDPNDPQILDDIYIEPATNIFAGLTKMGNMVYYANQRYLYTIDVSDPTAVQIVNEQEFNPNTGVGTCWGNLEAKDGYLYVAVTLALHIYSLEEPAAPELIYEQLPSNFTIYDLVIDGNKLITNHRSTGKWIILDITDPANPSTLYEAENNIFHYHYNLGTLKNDTLLVLDNGQEEYAGYTIHFLDVSKEPEIISNIESLPGKSRSVCLMEKDGERYALIAQDNATLNNYAGLLRIVNISNPENPELVSTLELPKGGVSIAYNGNNYVFIRGYGFTYPYFTQYLYSVNIEHIQSPYIYDVLNLDQSTKYIETNSLKYKNEYIYTVTQTELQVYEENSGSLSMVGNVALFGTHGFGVFVENTDRAFVAAGNYGLQSYSITNPQSPAMITWHETPGVCIDVYAQGGTAYCADYDQGLGIYDVSGNTIVPLSQLETEGLAITVVVYDDIAYVGLENGLIQMFDVSQPDNPQSLGWYITNSGYVWDIEIDDNYNDLYVAGELETLILHMNTDVGIDKAPSQTDRMPMLEITPNPVHQEANINFTIPNKNRVTINIYDSKGNKIETILNRRLLPGKHHIRWNTSDLANGVYLLNLQIGNKKEVRKIIVSN